MKFIFIIIASFSFALNMAAQHTTKIFINDKKAAEVTVRSDQPDAVLLIKKSAHKNYNSFIIQVSGEYDGGEIYKRTLELTGESSEIINETENKPGFFDFSKTDSIDQFISGKTITLYLLLNPSNPLMAIPSRRVFLGNLVMK